MRLGSAGLGPRCDAAIQALQRTLASENANFAEARRLASAGATGVGAAAAPLPAANPFATLPPRVRADDVVRDAGREAQMLGLAISTLSVAQQAASPREWGRVTFTVAASGEYRAAKAWLAAVLARYPSLAVQTLVI